MLEYDSAQSIQALFNHSCSLSGLSALHSLVSSSQA
jgi:hypothetical protein